jgi:hypothetical protein
MTADGSLVGVFKRVVGSHCPALDFLPPCPINQKLRNGDTPTHGEYRVAFSTRRAGRGRQQHRFGPPGSQIFHDVLFRLAGDQSKDQDCDGTNVYSCWTGLPACESRGRSVALRLLPIGYDAVLADAVKFSRSIFSGAKFPDAA